MKVGEGLCGSARQNPRSGVAISVVTKECMATECKNSILNKPGSVLA